MNTSQPAPRLKHWPERDEFFAFWDQRKKIVQLKHDSVIARMAGLDGSAPSAWRSGKQRPSAASLSAIAPVLETSAQELWSRAGMLAPEDIQPAGGPSIREDLLLIARALDDPNTTPETRVVIEATLELLLGRITSESGRDG